MNHVDATRGADFGQIEYRPWLEMLWRPLVIAAATVTVLILIIVASSQPAWSILGAGRGLVPEGFYPVSGFFLVFGLTFSHAIGWAIGSAIAFYLMTLRRYGATWETARIAMGVVYLALGPLTLLLYHVFYGGWLLSMPRAGLGESLAENHPGARWLLIYAHPIVDLSIIPLAAVFVAILWKHGERLQRDATLQTVLALTLLGSSLAFALSLAIHSTLVHARIGL
ncbi:MAG: hypothetical protein ACREQK_09170 [Candidatus Binatia bacterium]